MKYILTFFLGIFLCACSNQNRQLIAYHDFDHKVQYTQEKLNEHTYLIKIITNNKSRFSHLSEFLLRHSYKVCGQYGFQLTILSGIEDIDDKKISPSYIQPSLKVNLVCPSK